MHSSALTHRHTGCRQKRNPSPQIITQVYNPFINLIIVDQATSLWWPTSVESKAKATTWLQKSLHEKQNKTLMHVHEVILKITSVPTHKCPSWAVQLHDLRLRVENIIIPDQRLLEKRDTSVSILTIFLQGWNLWLGWSACALREKDVAHH